jgi:membrane-associated phospholipid phosphatase
LPSASDRPTPSEHQRDGARPLSGSARRLAVELAYQDWLVLGYFLILLACAGFVAPSPSRDRCLIGFGALLVVFLAALMAVRLRALSGPLWAPLVYRIGVYGSVQASYFFLRDLLPIVNTTRNLDATLYQVDLVIFGFEPAVVLEQWVSPLTTEWFSFFYFSYFCLLAFHIFPILALARNQQLIGEFSFSMLWLFCFGHIVYMLVPGYGPVVALSHEFQTPLPSGLWYDMVMGTVSSAGAQMDIFPSLHTAAPAFLTLFAFRYRRRLPYRFTWPILAFFTVNIVIATMYLRWHWIIDVVAGLLHAYSALLLAELLTRRELARRSRWQLTDSWPRFLLASKSAHAEPHANAKKLKAA